MDQKLEMNTGGIVSANWKDIFMFPLISGLLTGLLLQLAIGPIFFYILGITIASNYLNSLSAIIAVTIVDYLYIGLFLIGTGRLLESSRNKKLFGRIGASVLIVFGILSIYEGMHFFNETIISGNLSWTPITSFLSSFVLTISSPLTIVFWGSIFSAKAAEKNYNKVQLRYFGIGAGLATFVFMACVMLLLSLVKTSIPGIIVQVLNCIVGLILFFYGIIRLVKS